MRILLPRTFLVAVLALILVAGSMGCGSSAPTSPSDEMSSPDITANASQTETGRVLWGYWDIGIQKSTGKIEIVPLRGTAFHLNALVFMEPPAMVNLKIDSSTLKVDIPNNNLEVDVIFNHPFPGMKQFTGFDVRGIVLMPGTDVPFSDTSLVFSSVTDPQLLNPDGLTRWWNPREFPGTGIFRFRDGLIGKKGGAGVFNATINGYKYFSDSLSANTPVTDLAKDSRGVFSAGTSNRRRFEIGFGADSSDWLLFQYAVDASWAQPATMQDPVVPDDFPMQANAPEGYAVNFREVENTIWWIAGIGTGGSAKFDIDVYTWRPNAVSRVLLEAPDILANPVEATLVPGSGGGPDDPVYSTWSVEIQPEVLQSDGVKPCLITVITNESYQQGGSTVFFGPPGAKVSSYLRSEIVVNYTPPLKWKLVTAKQLPQQPTTTVKEMSVVGGGSYQGVYFFGDNYKLLRYNLGYTNNPVHASTLAGFFGYSELELYGAPSTLGRFDICPFGQFVASTISNAPSPTFLGGLKRDYAFFFNELYSPGGHVPAQIGLPNPSVGYFRMVDVCANWAKTKEQAKIYWIQVDDPEESTPPAPSITVILGVFQYDFSGNPLTGDVAYLSGSLVPIGSGSGLVNISCVDRFAVDSDPQEVTGSTDLITWFMETTPPALECFSVVSSDETGQLNQHLSTVTSFHATPRDIAIMPSKAGGFSKYNWVVVLEEGIGKWSLETFDQLGNPHIKLLDISGYPVAVDVDQENFRIHVWFTTTPGGPITAAVFQLGF